MNRLLEIGISVSLWSWMRQRWIALSQLRAKKKADKEREALIDKEGIDSIATISEHLVAEAKEAESEGGNKDAGK